MEKKPTKLEMMMALIPDAVKDPRYEGWFIGEDDDHLFQGWTKDDEKSENARKQYILNSDVQKLFNESKKNPHYIDKLLTQTSFPLEETYKTLVLNENPSREDLIKVGKLGWRSGDFKVDEPASETNPNPEKDGSRPWWMREGESWEKMPTDQIRHMVRNYAPIELVRASSQMESDAKKIDMENLITGKRKPRNIEELRILATHPDRSPEYGFSENADSYMYDKSER